MDMKNPSMKFKKIANEMKASHADMEIIAMTI